MLIFIRVLPFSYSMFNNQFSGSIPAAIANLKDLIALYLDTNKFTGQIPPAIGGMTSLIDLRYVNFD